MLSLYLVKNDIMSALCIWGFYLVVDKSFQHDVNPDKSHGSCDIDIFFVIKSTSTRVKFFFFSF